MTMAISRLPAKPIVRACSGARPSGNPRLESAVSANQTGAHAKPMMSTQNRAGAFARGHHFQLIKAVRAHNIAADAGGWLRC